MAVCCCVSCSLVVSSRYAVVTYEIKLFWNNFEIISVFYFTRNHVWKWNKFISATERVPKLFQNYLSNNEHVGKCSWTTEACEIIFKQFYFTCNHGITLVIVLDFTVYYSDTTQWWVRHRPWKISTCRSVRVILMLPPLLRPKLVWSPGL